MISSVLAEPNLAVIRTCRRRRPRAPAASHRLSRDEKGLEEKERGHPFRSDSLRSDRVVHLGQVGFSLPYKPHTQGVYIYTHVCPVQSVGGHTSVQQVYALQFYYHKKLIKTLKQYGTHNLDPIFITLHP